jgi:hypothetical protein
VRVQRLLDGPIISTGLHPSIGPNIQGPSMIRVPDWIDGRLGDYYLYFADTRAAASASIRETRRRSNSDEDRHHSNASLPDPLSLGPLQPPIGGRSSKRMRNDHCRDCRARSHSRRAETAASAGRFNAVAPGGPKPLS